MHGQWKEGEQKNHIVLVEVEEETYHTIYRRRQNFHMIMMIQKTSGTI